MVVSHNYSEEYGPHIDDDDDNEENAQMLSAIEEQSWRSYYSDIDGGFRPTGCCHC